MLDFALNDIVLYGSNGVCKVDAIEERDMGTYYILRPVHKSHTKLMVPTNNERLLNRIRAIPSAADAKQSIKAALSAEPCWISDANARKERAKEILESGTEYELLMLARSFYLHKQKVLEAGKKATSSDNGILRSAQERVRDEFSVVLGIEPEEVDEFIFAEA